jgi:hypothetical protein
MPVYQGGDMGGPGPQTVPQLVPVPGPILSPPPLGTVPPSAFPQPGGPVGNGTTPPQLLPHLTTAPGWAPPMAPGPPPFTFPTFNPASAYDPGFGNLHPALQHIIWRLLSTGR